MASNNWDDAFSVVFKPGTKVLIILTNNRHIIGTVQGNDRKFQRVIVRNDNHVNIIPYKYIMLVKLIEEEGNTDESNANT